MFVGQNGQSGFHGSAAKCLSLGSTAVIKTITKNNLGRKGYIWPAYPLKPELEAGIKAETVEDAAD